MTLVASTIGRSRPVRGTGTIAGRGADGRT